MSQELKIEEIQISSKTNGVSILIKSDQPVEPKKITGWFNASTSWYYITIFEANGDTTQLQMVNLEYPITDVEVLNIGESLQLGFRLSIPVEQFEFYHSDYPPEVMAALRFPLSDIMTTMAEETIVNQKTVFNPNETKPVWPKAFYFMGAGLAGAGLISGEEKKGWELTTGMGLIAVAYVYENILLEKKN